MDITKSNQSAIDKIEQLLVTGNLNQFSASERVEYVNRVCDAIGLSPLTRPFEFVTFQGKLVMYATKNCAEQLRKIHGVSIRIAKQEIIESVLFITVEAQDKTGRIDSDLGAINIDNLKGDAMANAVMKGITKAKRRVTLSICGLGMLDETEVDAMTYNYDENSQLRGLSEKALKDIDKRLDDDRIKREEKEAAPEREEEIQKEIIEIKGYMSVLTSDMKDLQEKGRFMFERLGVRSFGDLEKCSLGELKAKSHSLSELDRERKKRLKYAKPTFTLDTEG